jgi:hypothetical protein
MRRIAVRRSSLDRQGRESDAVAATAAQRMAMVWPLTLDVSLLNPDYKDILCAFNDAALTAFGAPLDDVTPDDLVSPEFVLQIGVAPRRITNKRAVGRPQDLADVARLEQLSE